MRSDRLDEIRSSVLDRMERAERNMKLGLFGAALTELVLFTIAFFMIDWDVRLERLLFIFAILTYTIIALGLVAVGAHVSRSAGRILAAMTSSERIG